MSGNSEKSYSSEIILFVLSFAASIINGYVISMFFRRKQLRSKSNLLLLNLACADFMTVTTNIPLIAVSHFIHEVDKAKAKAFVIAADVSTVLSAAITIQSLCVIVLDRFISICYSLNYVTELFKRHVVRVIISVWLLGAILSLARLTWLVPLLSVSTKKTFSHMVDNSEKYPQVARATLYDKWYYIVGCLLYFICIIGLMYAFIRMFIELHKVIKGTVSLSLSEEEFEQRQSRHKCERKAIILFSVMFLVFLVCWTPLVVLRLAHTLNITIYRSVPKILISIVTICRFLVCIMNPILYTLQTRDFWNYFRQDCTKGKYKVTLCFKSSKKEPEIHVEYNQDKSPQTRQLILMTILESNRTSLASCSTSPASSRTESPLMPPSKHRLSPHNINRLFVVSSDPSMGRKT